METEDFLGALDFLYPESSSISNFQTPKARLIRRETSVKTVKSVLAKRAFDFKFEEEDSSLKILKTIKPTQNHVFKAGQNSY
jgi:hypothetical protein